MVRRFSCFHRGHQLTAQGAGGVGVEAGSVCDGLASQLSGGADYDAALASPGEVIERGLAVDNGKIEKTKPKKSAGPTKARRAQIEKLQAALTDLDETHQSEVAGLDARQEALEAERQRVEADFERTRKGLTSDLKKARA